MQPPIVDNKGSIERVGCLCFAHICSIVAVGQPGQQIFLKLIVFKMLISLFLNQTLWCYHSLESSRRDDFNEGHVIGFGWEMKKLSWKPFCWFFLNCSPGAAAESEMWRFLHKPYGSHVASLQCIPIFQRPCTHYRILTFFHFYSGDRNLQATERFCGGRAVTVILCLTLKESLFHMCMCIMICHNLP